MIIFRFQKNVKKSLIKDENVEQTNLDLKSENDNLENQMILEEVPVVNNEKLTPDEIANLKKKLKRNKDRIKTLIVEQHERFLMAKMETMLTQNINIDKIMSIKTEVDNLTFFNSQNDLDKKLILLTANRDFIETLGEELLRKSESLRKDIEGKQRRRRYEDEDENEDNNSDNNAQEDSPPGENEYLDENQSLEDEEVKNDENENENENDENKSDKDSKLEEEEKLEDEDEKMIEENKDSNEDEIELENKDDEENKEEKDIMEEEEKDDEDILNQSEKMEEKSEEESSLATISDQLEDEEDEEENQEEIEDEERSYDYFVKEYNDLEIVENFGIIEKLMANSLEIKKQLNEKKFFNQTSSSLVHRQIETMNLSKWVEDTFLMLTIIDESQVFIRFEPNLYDMKPNSLIHIILFRSLLDPLKESVTLPVFVLHLLGYKNVFYSDDWNFHLLDDKILHFIYFYSQRSPSIFFKTMQLKNLLPYFKEGQIFDESLNEFSIFDLLFKLFISNCTTVEKVPKEKKGRRNEGKIDLVFQTLNTLLYFRYTLKEEETPEYIHILRKNNAKIIQEALINQILELNEKNEKGKPQSHIPKLCWILVYLINLPEYQRSILIFCENQLNAQIPIEEELLSTFIKNAKECLADSPNQITIGKLSMEDLDTTNIWIPNLFDVFRKIIEEVSENDNEMRILIQDSVLLRKEFETLSLLYMEALEASLRLQEKGYLFLYGRQRSNLKILFEMPMKYYISLSKLKDITGNSLKTLNQGDKTNNKNIRRLASNLDAGRALERSYTSIKSESTNFQEILPLWLTKCRPFVNSVFDSINEFVRKGQDKQGLWMVKTFPWMMAFKSKEKLLKFAYFQFFHLFIVEMR